MRQLRSTLAIAFIAPLASAQTTLVPVPTGSAAPTWVGVVDATTGVLDPAALRATDDRLYVNDAFLGSFLPLDPGEVVVDEGRLPSTTSTGIVGTFESYTLDALTIGYATDADGATLGGNGVRLRVALHERYVSCDPLSATPEPLVVVEFDAPGSSDGTVQPFTVDIDLSALGLCMRADGDGTFDGANDLFGWSLEVIDGGTGAVDGTGPLLAGDPQVAPFGDGTVFQNAGATAGTGLGTEDQFLLATPGGANCTWFGGYPAQNFASFWCEVSGDSTAAGDCIGCGLGDDRFEDNDTPASATPIVFGSYPGLVCDAEDDWYTLSLGRGDEVQIELDFSTNVADLDIYLFDAATMVELDRGFTGTDGEVVGYSNCGVNSIDILVLVDSFSSTCNTYDMRVVDPADRDDAFEDNDSCADAAPMPLGVSRDLVVRRTCALDPDYFAVTLQAGETLTVDLLFDGTTADINMALFDTSILACPGVAVAAVNGSGSSEHLEYANPLATPQTLVLGVGLQFGEFATYSMKAKVTPVSTVGELVCIGNPNSAGDGATLCGMGSSVATDDDVTFEVTGLPADVFGFFIVSKEIGNANPAASEGTLCIASLSIGRYVNDVLDSGPAGTFLFQPTMASIPFSAGGTFFDVAAEAGDTINFQAWYRDTTTGGMPTSNFSDALSITFE